MDFKFTYAGISYKKYIIGEDVNLKCDVKVKPVGSFDEGANLVYIPKIKFEAELGSTESFNMGFNIHGLFGIYYSDPLFLNVVDGKTTSILIPINTKKLEEMMKIRAAGRMISFYIKAEGLYSLYNDKDKQYDKFRPFNACVVKIMHDSRENKHIILTTEEFNEMVEDIKYFEIYKLEIPISKIGTPAQRELKQALDLMLNAKDKMIQNNYEGALLDIRNAISNHLFEKKNHENVLKEEITDHILLKVPTNAKDVYKDILKNESKLLNALLRNLHKFVHEDSDKLYSAPMPQDIESFYFITIHAIKHLTSYG